MEKVKGIRQPWCDGEYFMEGLIELSRKAGLGFTFLLPAMIIIIKPFGFDINQAIAIILTVSWWATGVVNKNAASVFLLAVFIFFSNTLLEIIFKFPLSSNCFLIVFAILITEGISRSNLINRISRSQHNRLGYSSVRLIFLSFLLGIILIFIVPQPFPRVILIAALYVEFLKQQHISRETFSAILFSIYLASTCTSMMFLNGDVILNYTDLQVGGINLNWLEWAVYMTIPSLIISILMYIVYLAVFKKDISAISFSVETGKKKGVL